MHFLDLFTTKIFTSIWKFLNHSCPAHLPPQPSSSSTVVVVVILPPPPFFNQPASIVDPSVPSDSILPFIRHVAAVVVFPERTKSESGRKRASTHVSVSIIVIVITANHVYAVVVVFVVGWVTLLLTWLFCLVDVWFVRFVFVLTKLWWQREEF